MLNKNKNNKGFTLVELLVVIAIIGILAVLAVPALFKNIEKGKVAELESDISAIRSAALSYYADHSEYPTNMDQLSSEIEGIGDPFNANKSDKDSKSTAGDGNIKGYTFSGEAPQDLVLSITTNGLSQDGYDKLVRDLGKDKIASDSKKEQVMVKLIDGNTELSGQSK